MKPTTALILTAVLVLGGTGATSSIATAATPKVVLYNLTDSPLVTPNRFFFQADAGPYLKDLVWSGWGTAEATGRGRYIRDCAVGPCGAPGENIQDWPVTFVVSDLGPCPRVGAGAQAYRSARVEIDRNGTVQTVAQDLPYGSCAKRPSRRAAEKGLAAYVKRRLDVSPTEISCRVPDGNFLNCVVRWRKDGKLKGRHYFVGASVSGRIEIHRARY